MVVVWFLRISTWVIRAIWIVVLATTLIELGFLAFHFTFHGSDAVRKWVIDTYGGSRVEGDLLDYQPPPNQVCREFTLGLLWQSFGVVVGLFLFPFLKRTQRKWLDELSYDDWSKALPVSPDRRPRNQAKPGVSSRST
jgi:hypothetical protein